MGGVVEGEDGWGGVRLSWVGWSEGRLGGVV